MKKKNLEFFLIIKIKQKLDILFMTRILLKLLDPKCLENIYFH